MEYNLLIFTEHEMVSWHNSSEKPGTLSHLVKRFTGEKHKRDKNALTNI